MNNQAAQTMPELPDSQYGGGNDVFGKEFPLYTADQMHQYARDYAAMLAAAPAASGGEDRLTRAEAIAEFRSRTGASVSERAQGYRHSTHNVHRGPESLPCYCTATIDHLIGEEVSNGEALARRFHEAYERLAPSFGYETRTETRKFDPTTPNGRLMIAVCSEITLEQALTQQRATTPQPSADAVRELVKRWRDEAEKIGLKEEMINSPEDYAGFLDAKTDELESLLSGGSNA